MNKGICPYPGLRPFTEEETIFFKGRDTHIRMLAKLLENKKMAFITGASGDGKSSLVYAGVIPFIRAGMLKAKFNNWLIFDFKPQRNPLKSLCESMSQQTGLDAQYLYNEFDNGFSSIIEVYKKSGLYVDSGELSVNKGKNLLIIADQFEEVFTNKENFDNGTPSLETYTTVNLLIETVRIAVSEKLPVYVMFTMRSDFIPQCTVFKNLPEFIAYSQFFVQQLKREEITQVIQEPAVLAGSSVSSRLTDYLVNNLSSGFDQLPVIQHAMNLLWKTANDGQQQLDLIHLAKIAGISKNVLDQKDREEFEKWFSQLPDYEKKYFEKPGLNNVLNAHAGILYESAYDYYQKNAPWAQKTITREESKKIIEVAFKSLVKIDNNRPVRNRCSLNEITGIINRENITPAVVCGVLNIFRSPDNTLLRPFIDTDNIETQYLSGDTVFDITHEALIRNWKKLEAWNAQDAVDIKDFYDLKSQLMRWEKHDRKKGFLLPAGNLDFFENMYSRIRPNAFWIARLDSEKLSLEKKLQKADVLTKQCRDFIVESRQAVEATQKAKKRKNRIIGVLIIGSLIFLSGFAFWALKERDTAQAQSELAAQKTKEAENQAIINQLEKERAVDAEKRADIERQKALQEALKAQEAQAEALKAYESANAARILADSMKNTALQNLQTAEKALNEAQEARLIAEEQTKKADKASDSAARLYNIAVSNALAMKAKNRYEDKSMNLRLAWSAWLINKEFAITENMPELYEAMISAMRENGFDNSLKINDEKISDFYINSSNRLFTVTDRGEVAAYKIAGDKPKELFRIKNTESSTPLQKAFFLSDKYFVYSTFDKKNFVIDINGKTISQLKPSGYINSAVLSEDGRKIIAAFDNGNIFIYDAQLPEKGAFSGIDLKQKIMSVCLTEKPEEYYALTHFGTVLKCNSATGEVKEVFKKDYQNAFALADIRDKNMLAVCYGDGAVTFIDTKTEEVISEFSNGFSKFERAVYDQGTGFLALSGGDRRISLINTKDLTLQPFLIEEQNLRDGRANSLKFNGKGMIFALTDKNSILYWDTDINQYAKTLQTLNLQPLTRDEKKVVLGREFAGGL